MAEKRVQRKLAAIISADVVGYSRLVREDEEGTVAAVKAAITGTFAPSIKSHGGRIFKTMGDAVLAEFPSVVDALQCAVAVQKALSDNKLVFRIGINVGDVIIEGGDIHGDGVNIAARLEGLAEPGGICISGKVLEEVRDKVKLGFKDLGAQKVKNIDEPVSAYQVLLDPDTAGAVVVKPRVKRQAVFAALAAVVIAVGAVAWWQFSAPSIERASAARMKFALPDKPSIAVLPFSNLSKDKDQDFFADGIADDIITDLSKISGIFVTAKHSTLGYKGKAIKIRQISEELGVRNILSGSVRRDGVKLRITVQLVDAIKGDHLWSNRYDREVKDVFAVQTDVTRRVVKAMAVTLKARERDRVFQKYVTTIEAYDAWQQARAIVEVPSRENILKGEALFKKTILLDPKFAGGYAGLSFNHSVKARFGYSASQEADATQALALAKKAIDVDPDFAWSHIAMAGAHLANGRHDAAVDAAEKALSIQPGGYETNLFMGFYLFWAGRSAQSVKHLETANKLNRVPAYRDLIFLGIAYLTDGSYAKSEATLLKAQKLVGRVGGGYYVILAVAQVAQNKMAEAKATVSRLNRIRPGYRLSNYGNLRTFKSKTFQQRLIAWAVKAGIPE